MSKQPITISFDPEMVALGPELLSQQNPIVSAINTFNLEKFNQAIDQTPGYINTAGAWGAVPLHFAANRNPIFTQKLLEKSANVNATDRKGNTPLHVAIDCGREDIVKLLLKANADSDIKNNAGESPLMQASMLGNNIICDLMYEYKPTVHVVFLNGELPDLPKDGNDLS